MKKSYLIEILIFIVVAVASQILFLGDIFGFFGGMIIIFFASYYLVTKLKKQTIKEYLTSKEYLAKLKKEKQK